MTLASKDFLDTLLNPNMKGQVSSSYLMIAGYCMLHVSPSESQLNAKTAQTTDGERTRLQKQIFEAMVGFCTSNSVHARCIAQWYVVQMF